MDEPRWGWQRGGERRDARDARTAREGEAENAARAPSAAPSERARAAGRELSRTRGFPELPSLAWESSPCVLTAHGLSVTWLAEALSMEQK